MDTYIQDTWNFIISGNIMGVSVSMFAFSCSHISVITNRNASMYLQKKKIYLSILKEQYENPTNYTFVAT